MRSSLIIAIVATALLGSPLKSHAANGPTRDEVVGLVTHMLQSWAANDPAAFTGAFTKGAVFAYPGGRMSTAEAADMFKQYQSEHTDIKIYIGDFVVQGNRFAGQYQFAATDRKSGKRTAVGTGIAGVVEGGKLTVFKEYWDQHILNWQVEGKIPLDEGQIYPAPASLTLGSERVN